MSMTVVIGAASTASLGGDSSLCIISANWGFEPGRQDAFCLGSWTPSEDHLVYKPQQTLSLTLYAPGPTYDVTPTAPSSGCEDAGTIQAAVDAQTCEGGEVIEGSWHVTSYSFSKESKDQPGQESWSMTKWKGASAFLTGAALARSIEPTWIMRGITQGQSTDPESDTGIVFSSEFADSKTGSVSAGAIGKASTITHGIVDRVGGGTSDINKLGNGSASIQYTQVYI